MRNIVSRLVSCEARGPSWTGCAVTVLHTISRLLFPCPTRWHSKKQLCLCHLCWPQLALRTTCCPGASELVVFLSRHKHITWHIPAVCHHVCTITSLRLIYVSLSFTPLPSQTENSHSPQNGLVTTLIHQGDPLKHLSSHRPQIACSLDCRQSCPGHWCNRGDWASYSLIVRGVETQGSDPSRPSIRSPC